MEGVYIPEGIPQSIVALILFYKACNQLYLNDSMHLKRALCLLNPYYIFQCIAQYYSPSMPTLPVRSKITLILAKPKPSCGCCKKWIEHLSADNTGDHEFKVYAHNNSKLEQLKANKGIAPRYQSCHTALSIEGYVFEGHIPAKIIKQFLANKPSDAIGLSVPGMPAGSPGMEMGNRFSPYDVLLLRKDGSSEIYAHITLQKEQY